MITIDRENCARFMPDMGPLLERHWREVALYQKEVALAPDLDRYCYLEKIGKLVVLAARDEGRLVGYSVFLLNNHLHYKACLVASNDVIFLEKEHRTSSSAGIRLIKESEQVLAGLRVNRLVWHIKPGNDWSAILKRMGYELEETIMGKLLTGVDHGL